MSARRKRVISTEEIQFNHNHAKMLLTEKKKGVSQNGQTPSIIGICSYCVLDRPVFEPCQTLLHPELTPWWSLILADGVHHKKPHSPTHPLSITKFIQFKLVTVMITLYLEAYRWNSNVTFDTFKTKQKVLIILNQRDNNKTILPSQWEESVSMTWQLVA